MRIDAGLAGRFARVSLGHVRRPYPYKMDHVLASDGDARRPQDFHPIFYGSFDWHSCVHGWWTLLTLRRLVPDMPEAAAIADLADDSFTAPKIAGELAYLDRPTSRGFERPYGWAWLLYLHLEAARHGDRSWAQELAPLAGAFAGRLRGYLEILTYPIRVGTHFNTCFALILAFEWAERFDPDLAKTIRRKRAWFASDRDCQAWEPGGDDFLSSALTEAHLMARISDEAGFDDWFAKFLPHIRERQPATLFTPPTVSDRSDGKIAHLDGLNLSRAWSWRTIAPLLPSDVRDVALEAADRHFEAALPHVSGDYMGEHWLASFALLALLTPA